MVSLKSKKPKYLLGLASAGLVVLAALAFLQEEQRDKLYTNPGENDLSDGVDYYEDDFYEFIPFSDPKPAE